MAIPYIDDVVRDYKNQLRQIRKEEQRLETNLIEVIIARYRAAGVSPEQCDHPKELRYRSALQNTCKYCNKVVDEDAIFRKKMERFFRE